MVAAAAGRTFETVNPSTGEVLAVLAEGDVLTAKTGCQEAQVVFFAEHRSQVEQLPGVGLHGGWPEAPHQAHLFGQAADVLSPLVACGGLGGIQGVVAGSAQ